MRRATLSLGLLLLFACAHDRVPPASPPQHEGFAPGDARHDEAQGDTWRSAVVAEERPMMGTYFRVSVLAEDGPNVREAIAACFGHFAHVDRTMSEWRQGSPLSALNRQAGVRAVQLPDDLYALLEDARQIAEASEGAFDPTWAALWGLWKFDGSGEVPTEAELAARLPLVGWRDLILERETRTAKLRREGMAVGLGGIAKGYALELAQRELRRRGFVNFLLYAGGQVYAAGRKREGPWTVGIQAPRGKAGESFASIEVTDQSVSTSGDYERAFVKDGVRYHHILELRTGHPARGVRSATVLSPDATLADAYSTASFVLGPERALALARQRGFEVLLVDDAGRLHLSEGMRDRVRFLEP